MDTRPEGLDGELARQVIKHMSRLNVRLYRLTGGRVGGRWRIGAGWRKPAPILLLDHRGRTTGRPRTSPLVYLRDGDRLVVVASQGGRATHPQWFHNVEADPRVGVQVGSRRTSATARTASTEERDRLWPRLTEVYADFDSYQSWTNRTIPVVILEPTTGV